MAASPDLSHQEKKKGQKQLPFPGSSAEHQKEPVQPFSSSFSVKLLEGVTLKLLVFAPRGGEEEDRAELVWLNETCFL